MVGIVRLLKFQAAKAIWLNFFFYYTAELFTKWRIGKNRTLVSHFYLVTLYYN